MPASNMQEKKNKRLLILFVVLATSTIAVGWYLMAGESDEIDKSRFKKFDLQTVDKIVLQQHDDTVTLSFNGSRWLVNNQSNADAKMIDVLFATIHQAEPKRPVSRNSQDSIYQALDKDGVHVSVFTKDEKVGAWLAGGDPGKRQAYFALPSDQEVFMMTIPGYRVYAAGVFELERLGWHDKRVFAFNWQNFSKLEVTFPKQASQNFSVVMNEGQVIIPGIQAPDTAHLNSYLDAVSLLTVDDYLPASASLDSLLSVEPIQILTVNDIAKRNYVLKLYASKTETVFGLINDQQWAAFDTRNARQVVHPKDFFVRH